MKIPTREQQLGLILASSLFVNGLLARQVYSDSRLLAQRNPATLQVGDSVPTLTATDLTGAMATIDPRNTESTVLYVFAPACGWCARNLDNLRAVAEAAAKKGLRFIAVSITDDDVKDYAREHNLAMPVVIASPQSKSEYRLGATPHTLVIDRQGRVSKSWRGAFTGSTAKEISEFFGAALPGLIEVEPKAAEAAATK
jgi:peroxiredoxin